MEDFFNIKLSAEEILVIAALCNYECFLAINLNISDSNINQIVRCNIKKLERKKLIRYSLDGTLQIKKEIYDIIKCICEAEKIVLFFTNIETFKNHKKYVFYFAKKFVTLTQLHENKYLITLSNEIHIEKILPQYILKVKGRDWYESLTFEQANKIKSYLQGFNEMQANKILEKQLNDKSKLPMISKILFGNSDFLNIQIWQKYDVLYKLKFESLISVIKDSYVCVKLDENDIVHFNSKGLNELYKQLQIFIKHK